MQVIQVEAGRLARVLTQAAPVAPSLLVIVPTITSLFPASFLGGPYMKAFVALVALVGLVVPARAHFIWLLPPKDRQGGQAQMVFSDALEADKNVPIAKIENTKLFARKSDGKSVGVIDKLGKHQIEV